MRIGIFGSRGDAQCQALEALLIKRGVTPVLVESQALNRGEACTFDGEDFLYKGESLRDVGAWYLRHIMSAQPPVFKEDEDYYLFTDWHREYMFRRERAGFAMSWLLHLSWRGVPVVNPPEHGSVIQLKPFQLAAAREVGLQTPATLITNDPQRVLAFDAEVDEVVYKPSMGGGLCVPLDAEAKGRLEAITAAPVTFQERVRGTNIRLTMIGDEPVSTVTIPSDMLDFREDPNYQGGGQQYEQIELPDAIIAASRELMRACGLVFSGIDFIRTEDGRYVFLEANSSPIYLDVERKTQVPITDKLVSYLLLLANDPQRYKDLVQRAKRSESFVAYALPFAPDKTSR